MQIQFGPLGSNFNWACAELGRGLCNMLPTIYGVAEDFAKNQEDPRNLFILLACPCCERSGIQGAIEGSVIVTPFKGIACEREDKVTQIDIYPPFRNRDGKDEARDEKQFAEHWERTLKMAVVETS